MQATRVRRHFSSEEKYYMCGRCQNHIVLEQNIVCKIYQDGVFTGFCIFEILMNVDYFNLPDEDRVQRVHCRSCNTPLGFRYFRVPAAQLCPLVQNGRSKLSMDRLSYWNGSQRLNGYTEMLPEPVPGPEPAFRLVSEPHLPNLIDMDMNPLQEIVDYNVTNVPQPLPPAEGDDDPEPVPGPEPHLPNPIDMDMNPLQAIVGYNVTNVPQPQPPAEGDDDPAKQAPEA